jgi:hypothetical protein
VFEIPSAAYGRNQCRPNFFAKRKEVTAKESIPPTAFLEEKQMKHSRFLALCISSMLSLMLYCAAVKGAAILDHPCGKLAVKTMGLIHAGKFEEMVKLSGKKAQEEWKAMPANDKRLLMDLAQQTSQTEEQYSADIKAYGLLVVDGASATLTVKKTTKDKSGGTSNEETEQTFKIDAGRCVGG